MLTNAKVNQRRNASSRLSDDDVIRLDIAMNDPCSVSDLHRRAYVLQYPGCAVEVQLGSESRQRNASERNDYVRRIVQRIVNHLQDMRGLECLEGLDLLFEPSEPVDILQPL